ncbi:DNA methyltransferase [Nocardioides sp. SOB77]|uniref:DNA methyltransferase n=1 Tax=Nocardioides oceani TaxID=3058369 RepID=A0ABT8FM32_9ACTN|nr:DNA methyltransferase [Nocardioides oceani]MDN4175580.1 DNA methyltransferase [Nocardioides oceani]
MDKVADPALRQALREQVDLLTGKQAYGLVFQDHQPETVELPDYKVRRGCKVRLRRGGPALYTVEAVRAGTATVRPLLGGGDEERHPTSDLTVVREFGDPIYPGLASTGSVRNGGDKPPHLVINAENFHALETLLYTHEGAIDAIYIDPPYNTRDKDWKYNNNYVDSDDIYRHSKWLAMMERRLLVAQRLLNPEDSVLIVTIDEKEYLRLGLLLEKVFKNARIQMVSSVINRKGVPRRSEFARVDEYIFFVMLGSAGPDLHNNDMLTDPRPRTEGGERVTWVGVRRRGSEWRRTDRPGSFFPIFVDEETAQVVDVGEPLDLNVDRRTVPDRPGLLTVWPLNRTGQESRWQLSPAKIVELRSQGYLRSSFQRNGRGVTLEYLSEGQRAQIASGDIVVTGHDENGAAIAVHPEDRLQQAKTIWNLDSHGATAYGTQLVSALLPGRVFPYPKSLYAVEDALRFFVADKPEATVLDFFAGSGTTMHAVARLNRQDGGARRSICVTNNEVSHGEAAELSAAGYAPGDPEWEALGICEYVTKPRVAAAITGRTPQGDPVRGSYKFVDPSPIADGLEENAEFFTLSYEDPDLVGLGRKFKAIAPLLWLKAGGAGAIIDELNDSWALPVEANYGILFDVNQWRAFVTAVRERAESLEHMYVVTDSDATFQQIVGELPADIPSTQLYSDYLRTFEINTRGQA